MDQDQKTVQKLKSKLTATIVVLVVVIVAGVFMLSGLSVNQIVLALSGNYSKATGDELTAEDWNDLDDDFATVGTVLDGMIDDRIDAQLAIGGTIANAMATTDKGGDVFVHWGNENCPSGTEKLYRGFGFGSQHAEGGSSEYLCLQNPNDPGAETGDIGYTFDGLGGRLYPMATTHLVPPGFPVPDPAANATYGTSHQIKCAVCFNPRGSCYERWYGTNCPGSSGFTPVYAGYAVSGYYNNKGRSSVCLDPIGFDSSVESTGLSWKNNAGKWKWQRPSADDAAVYPVGIYDSKDVSSYSEELFVRCAVCCKN